jgi:hypothetical protein
MKPLREGVLVGLVGAFALALWFLLVDLVAGHPLHTPNALGIALFGGRHVLGSGFWGPVLGYTIVHGAVFIAAGILMAHVTTMLEAEPAIFLVAFFALFVFFEFTYFVYAVVFVQRVLNAVSVPALIAGNVVAAGAMGSFLYRRHPRLHFKLEPKLNA